MEVVGSVDLAMVVVIVTTFVFGRFLSTSVGIEGELDSATGFDVDSMTTTFRARLGMGFEAEAEAGPEASSSEAEAEAESAENNKFCLLY